MIFYLFQGACLLWEQELYNQFKYKSPRPYFHTLDTDVSDTTELYFLYPRERIHLYGFVRQSWLRTDVAFGLCLTSDGHANNMFPVSIGLCKAKYI